MIRIRYLVAAGTLAALAAGGALGARQAMPSAAAPPARSPAAPLAPTRLTTTQALFDGYIRDDKMPGIVALVGRGDAPAMVARAGHISDDPGAPAADPDTLWRVYSMTKPITAMAAMMLVEEGKLRLDQPVSDFIPAFKHMRVQTSPASLDSRPATKPITIRNLLTHTAGLGYTIVTTGPLLKAYQDAGITPFTADAKSEVQLRQRRPATLEAFANAVATLPLIAEPGTKWSYSIGLDVMGRVIEVAGGMPFDAFLQRRIFTPLGMRSSFFTVPASEVGRFATGYAILGKGRFPLDPARSSVYLTPPSFPYGGAGLVTSARDYDRFLHMLQNGGTLDGVRVMKARTVALALSNLLPAGVFYPGAVAATGGTTTPQGFGAGGSVVIAAVPGGPARGTYGWGGAAGTIAWVDPVNKVRATIMVNYLPGDKWPVRAEATRTVYADVQGGR